MCLAGAERFGGIGGDVELDHPVDVFVLGWPGKRWDRVGERDASAEPGPEVGGLGESVLGQPIRFNLNER